MAQQQQQHQPKVRLHMRMPSILFICGSMLVIFALLSIVTGPFLDLDQFPHPYGARRSSLALQKETSDQSRAILSNLSHVLNEGGGLVNDIWDSKFSELYYGCSDPSTHFTPAVPERDSNGYLMIAASGGLNQQRTGITDAVVVARILNATLVVPELDHNSFWKDTSNFNDIFNVDWFISSLLKDVTIVKKLPESVKQEIDRPYTMRVPRKSTPHFYKTRVLPVLHGRHVCMQDGYIILSNR